MRYLISTVFAAALVSATYAQEAAPVDPVHPVDPKLARQIERQPAAVLKQYLDRLYALSPDGVINVATLEARAQAKFEQMRSRIEARWQRFDPNGDGRITQGEIEEQLPGLPTALRSELFALRLLVDRDKDGTLSVAELGVEMDRQLGGVTPRDARKDLIFQFDLNRDDTVTEDEVVGTVEAVLAARDARAMAPVVKKLSPAQRQAMERRAEVEAAVAASGLLEVCRFPPRSAQAIPIAFNAHEGEALSTVSLSEDGRPTTVANLHLEDGDTRPVYIFAGSEYSVIWHVTGAVERVERLVTHPGNAVLGLPETRVHFAPQETCVPLRSKTRNSDRKHAREALMSVALDLAGDDFKERNMGNIRRLVLPGLKDIPDIHAQLGKIKPGSQPVADRNGTAYDADTLGAIRELSLLVEQKYPAGIVEIDPDRVVSRVPVQSLDLLPEPAGFLQMIERGDVVALPGTRMMIVRPVSHLPPLSYPDGSMRIAVKPGVALDPASGNLNRYRIYEYGTDACVAGPKCAKSHDLE